MNDRSAQKGISSRKLIQYTAVVFRDGRLKFLELTGRAVSISANSLCFLTRYPLKAGHVIEFREKVLNCSHGVIMWIRRAGGAYVAGTRLIRRSSRKQT